MNDDNIKREIKNYMKNPLSYALLLEGNWGSGKTYFIQNKLDEIETIYVSLYGVHSISNLSFQLCCQLGKYSNNKILKKLLNNKKSNKTVGTIGSILVSNLENKFEFSFKELINLIEGIDLKNKLIIFDDLERSSMPIDEILGFINNLIEHNKIKVLLVANEKEIETRSNYTKFKEKLIYQTFKYKPNLNEIYDYITSDCTEIVSNNKDFLIKELERKNHINIRTMQFIIQRFKELEKELKDVLEKLTNKEVVSTIKNELFQNLVIISIEYKMGEELPEFKENGEISYYQLSKSTYSSITIFKFINAYILGYEIDKIKILNILINYSNEIISSLKGQDNPLQILNCWWESEDEEIKKSNEKILAGLKDNQYSFDLYPKILIYLINVKLNGFGSYILDQSFEAMKNNIIKSQSIVSFGYRIIDTINEAIKEEYYSLKKELDNIAETHNKALKDNSLLLFISKEPGKMGEYLYINCIDTQNEFLTKKEFIGRIENKNIIYLIKNGNSTDIRFLIYLFNDIYNYANVKELYPNDLSFLKELLNLLEQDKKNRYSMMKRFNFNSFKECVNEIIKKLE